MALPDPRMAALNNFTNTKHGPKIPSNLSLNASLPPNFTVLILGASEGIGEHVVYAYARACQPGSSLTIIITARNQDKLERVRDRVRQIREAESLGQVRVEISTCDIASASSMEALAHFTESKTGGRLDCVIVNAAYAPPVTLRVHLDLPENVQRAFDVNAMGTFHAAHYFVPMLLSSSGSDSGRETNEPPQRQPQQCPPQFIAVGSAAGSIRRGSIANMGYCVGKMAQTRIIEYLSEQYSADNLFSISVHPGAVLTSMAEGNTPESFMPYLVDDVALCGAFCAWLSKKLAQGELGWLNGRFVSANWDAEELLSKEDDIVKGDLLKFAMTFG